jgi:EAL domain-containing protein (putative c-di-GMP-specific phosphodiesterase class I)
MALSVAKAQPGNTFAFFAPDMDERLREKQDMEVALRRALELNQFHLVYQPQIRLEDGELVGVEALVRWTHPTMGPIPPSKFIPVAEETGLIIELGYCILKSACAEARKWPAHIQLAVNVSPMQFEFGDLTRDVAEVLEETGLPASRLDIEITEGMLISNPVATTATLQALRRMGLGIALDDFGTGYSSLSYLGRLPVDKIKIDQSFVKGLPGDEQSGAIIRAVMTLSESLGKIVVAEGIENADQAWMLRLAGADIGQVYHFSRPLGAAELLARIARSTPDAAVRDAG